MDYYLVWDWSKYAHRMHIGDWYFVHVMLHEILGETRLVEQYTVSVPGVGTKI
jgi:hypothetical protein